MYHWLIFAFLALMINVSQILFIKWSCSNTKNFINLMLNFMIVVGIYAFILVNILKFQGKDFSVLLFKKGTKKEKMLLLIVPLLLLSFTSLKYISANSAPNPGFTTGIIGLTTILVTILSSILFKSVLNTYVIIGLVLSFAGLIMAICNV